LLKRSFEQKTAKTDLFSKTNLSFAHIELMETELNFSLFR